MIQSIGDYETWRDRQYDHPQPDDGPDERSIRFYSHDYPADTTLEYTRTGDHSELRLSFSSEDPDSGTEELVYVSENGKSMQELTADLKEELAAYLDAADTSSFYQQQGIPQPYGMHGRIDYGEYSRTSLYAFEAILRQTERESIQNLVWKPLSPDKQDWVYSSNQQVDLERGCIGHLRGDFGSSGAEFWTTWFHHQPGLRSKAFQDELQDVVNGLRKGDGLLQSFKTMSRQCRGGLACDGSFCFQAETRNYTYCLRCMPRRGDYHFYLYAYDKNAQRKFALEKASRQSAQIKPGKTKMKKNEMEVNI